MARAPQISLIRGTCPDAHHSLPWVLAGLALALFWHLHFEWSVNPQYSHGWGVPFLTAYLFWKRWSSRPAPTPAPASFPFHLACALALASLLPLRLIHEANPDWRLTAWALAASTTTLALCLLRATGGTHWPRHFLIPTLLPLLAVPWPTRVEQHLVQSLMRAIAAGTAEIMNLFGIAAWPRGNLIELANGVVGVDEACSGIRSLQSALLAAVVLGELCRLRPRARTLLLGVALAWTITLNFFRTAGLTWICAHHGPDRLAHWHDPAGYVTLFLALAGTWHLAHRLRPSARPQNRPPHDRLNVSPLNRSSPPNFSTPLFSPRQLGWTILAGLLFAELGTSAWYRNREASLSDQPTWTVKWPTREQGFLPAPLPERVQVILRCDTGQSGRWQRADGSEWTLFFFQWHPGRLAAQLAQGHTPDVCLPANGFTLVDTLEPTVVQLDQITLPFHTYVFENRGQSYFVFFCLMDAQGGLRPDQAGTAAQSYLTALNRTRRLQAVWNGLRHRGQQVLEIAVTGYPSADAARTALQATLPELIQL